MQEKNVFVRIVVVAVLMAAVLGPAAGSAWAVNNGDIPVNTTASARRVIEDLCQLGDNYPQGKEFLGRLEAIETKLAANANDGEANGALQSLIREATLANPLLDFDRLAILRRKGEANRGANYQTSSVIRRDGWDNEISVLSNLRGVAKTETLYRSPNNGVMKHMDVDFSGEKIMFSGIGKNGNWAILEVDRNGRNVEELTPDDQPDVQWFDGCYLPEQGVIVACSTAGMQGLPCVNGSEPMANLYKVDRNKGQIRQLTFEQDSDWHPRVMQNGRLMYLRWEYTDTPHYYSRYLFHMNPDGTGQMELWGSGSYFPTAYVHARPIPDRPSMAVGLVSGHHAKGETGRLMLIDWQLARKYPLRNRPKDKIWGPENSDIDIYPDVFPAEKTGCVQEIPGYGRDVVGNVRDGQGDGQTYTFQTPWPLSDKYFLVSMKGCPTAKNRGKWSLCLVDVFDNMTVLYEDSAYDVFEPIPLVPRRRPPVLVDRTVEGQPAMVFCTNIYDGRGLKGIPHGSVKNLRVFSYHYGYMQSGGHESCGLESGWDIKRILGTVPVEEDGSFCFLAPANTPLAIQPLDEEGAAVQLMRSWMVGMPGERLACNGCHEDLSQATPARRALAGQRPPRQIEPWHGPVRPFSYAAEIQPMLDVKCVGCHNNQKFAEKGRPSFEKGNPDNWRNDRSYLNLCAYTRHWGPESDLDMYHAMEWHASTSPLVRMFKKGHYGVELSAEDWDRLYTWIDLNSPHRGMWNNPHYEVRRNDLADLYAGIDDNPEEEMRTVFTSLKDREPVEPILPKKIEKPGPDGLKAAGFPFQAKPGATIDVDLADGLVMRLVRIPSGQFVMGSQDGFADESPRAVVQIDRPFWLGECEVTNAQYAVFDPDHDTRYLDETGKDHAVPGYIANHADQPVARISWQEAMRFCQWLSKGSGKKVTLPTEAQWEWAARAGSEKQFFYGDRNTDFSRWANLADASRQRLFVSWDGGSKVHKRQNYPDDYLFPLRDHRFTDKWIVVDFVKQYEPSPLGLYDIVGNVGEWTRSSYRPYPYDEKDGRNDGNPGDKKVARGGSWNDRPANSGSTIRFAYESYQKVYNVGFRVMIEE